MEKLKLYLCRHGETEWALSGKHTGSTDIPLTKEGKNQALLLGKRLYETTFQEVYSSPLTRALETCRLSGLGDRAVETPLLKEWDYGSYEGLTTKEIQKKDPSWNIFEKGAPSGESSEKVGKRADQFLKKLEGKTGNIALFSHGHFLRALAARWIQERVEVGKKLSLTVSSLCILSYEHDYRVIQVWNDTSHL